MQSKHILITVLVGILGLAVGFMLANKLNRAEFERLRPAGDAANTSTNSRSDADLSDEEINAKLEEAAASPDDLKFQKGLGVSLYRFGTMKRDAELIEKALIPLNRANALDPKDNEIISILGNAYFDLGYFKTDNASLERSRPYYEDLLNKRPDDVETRTDLGLSYFLTDPPDLEHAAREFELALAKDPKHEKALQFYIQTLAKQNKKEKARQELAKLRAANPKNPALTELEAFLNKPTEQ